MDAASRRVRPVDLARLQTLRSRREDEARRAVRAGVAAREMAEAETLRAGRRPRPGAERLENERVLRAKLDAPPSA